MLIPRKIGALCLGGALLIGRPGESFGEKGKPGAQSIETSIEVEYDADEPEAPDSFFPRVEEIFANPALASGLASGADAINRSIDSLMEAIFYGLLDNELRYDLNDHSWFSIKGERDLYDTTAGAYVVVDRFALGPRHQREISRVHEVSITLGADATIEVLQIYARSDGMRVAESSEVPWFRRWANNWFGIIPLLSAILPPSFNPNEMYDPIRLLETPFVFPLDVETFREMPIGSIRSYSIGGGVTFGVSFSELIGPGTARSFEQYEDLTPHAPYNVFVQGEHRINVFRKEREIAWVGVTNVKRLGHGLGTSIGNTLHLLKGAFSFKWENFSWVWTGFPLPLFPLDANFEQAIADQYDQLYQFDLSNPEAVVAYHAAVRGDFATARSKYLLERERNVSTGVTFEFTKSEVRRNIATKVGPSLTVYRTTRTHDHSRSTIEIRDQEGKFYILEAKQQIRDDAWDALVGGEEKRYASAAKLRVRKVFEEVDGELNYYYAFEPSGDPMRLTLTLNIQDSYTDAEEYAAYVQLLREFTELDLEDVPAIPVRSEEESDQFRRSSFFDSPAEEATRIHTLPTVLGRFGAQAAVLFPSEAMEDILSLSDDEYWRVFARVLNQNEDDWGDEAERLDLGTQLEWFVPFFFSPLRLFNVRHIEIDAIKEVSTWVEALSSLREARSPSEALISFNRLFDSDYPEHLARGLLALTKRGAVARSVSFFTKPSGIAPPQVHAAYKKLNGKIFQSDKRFPPDGRYEKAQAKLAEFYLDQPRVEAERPVIRRLKVFTEPHRRESQVRDPLDLGVFDPLLRNIQGADSQLFADDVFIRIVAQQPMITPAAKVYVKVEQAGRVDIGRLNLAESVLEVEALDALSATELDRLVYEINLTGAGSPLRNFVFDQALQIGTDLSVTLSVSLDGQIWSEEKNVEFRVESGRLLPIEE